MRSRRFVNKFSLFESARWARDKYLGIVPVSGYTGLLWHPVFCSSAIKFTAGGYYEPQTKA